MMKSYWDSTEVLFQSTSAMFRFSKKLKNLKPLIRELGREQLGDLTKKRRKLRKLLVFCVRSKKLH